MQKDSNKLNTDGHEFILKCHPLLWWINFIIGLSISIFLIVITIKFIIINWLVHAIITSCFAFLLGMWAFAGSVYKRPSWFGFTWFTIGASFIGLVLSIVFTVQSYVPASGLLQRAFYLVLLIWIETVSIWLFRLTFKPQEETSLSV